MWGKFLLLIALERSIGVSEMSAFVSLHYYPTFSATSCRRWEVLSCSLTSLENKMFHLNMNNSKFERLFEVSEFLWDLKPKISLEAFLGRLNPAIWMDLIYS